jgi:hypothetical protein
MQFSKAAVCAFLMVITLSLEGGASAQAASVPESQIKAAFLYNFVKFFEWPADALGEEGHPFALCVLGESSISRDLQQFASNKSVDGHPLQVRMLQHLTQARDCRIVFVGAGEDVADHSLARLAEERALTVGEIPGFCSHGGVVNFWTEGDHVRFEVNPKAADKAHVRASSKLLRLARIVDESTNAGRGR